MANETFLDSTGATKYRKTTGAGTNPDPAVAHNIVDSGNITEDNSAAILTALQLLDDFISGSRGLVTEDNSAAILADTTAIKNAVEILDNAIAANEMQVDVVTLPGTVAADITAIKNAVEIIDNAIAASEMQVDVVTMPAVSAAITDVIPGTAENNLGKLRDAASTASDVGVAPMAVRDDTLSTLTEVDGDYTPLRTTSKGALHTNDVDTIAALASLETAVAAVQTAVEGTLDVGGSTVTANLGTTDTNNLASVVTNTAIKRDRTLDNVGAALVTDVIMNDTTVLTPKFATVTASASGGTKIIDGVASKKLRVLGWTVGNTGASTVDIKWQSDTTSPTSATDITGLMPLGQDSCGSPGFSPVGHFETVAGEALWLNLSAAIAVGGVVQYIEV